MKTIALLSVSMLLLATACANKQSQNVYKEGEVGISRSLEYGTVRKARDVKIEAKNSGVGTLLGAGVGAGAGSYVGGGSGNAWATAGAAVAGAVLGHYAEQEMNNRTGIEYTVTMQSGETKTIVQEIAEGEEIFRPGQKVALQYCDRGDEARQCTDGKMYQRLVAVDEIPAYTKKRRKLVK